MLSSLSLEWLEIFFSGDECDDGGARGDTSRQTKRNNFRQNIDKRRNAASPLQQAQSLNADIKGLKWVTDVFMSLHYLNTPVVAETKWGVGGPI